MKTNHGMAALAVLLASISSAAAAEPTRWAILVGVNDYANLQHLKFASRDVETLADRLSQSGFPQKQIFLLRDGAKESKYLPIKANIEKQLDLVLNLAGRDDLILLAFCGHGVYIDGTSYLCPTEADVEDPRRTMLAVDDVYNRLAKCRAAMKLVVLDACRDDPRPPGKRSATPKDDSRRLVESIERHPDGMKLLSSCGVGQASFEDAEFQHGVFMHFLLEGLSGKADSNKNGKVSLGELHEYVSQEVKVHVARKWSSFQEPFEKGELNGVFEFASSSAPAGKLVANTLGMKFVLVPAGEFLMGTAETNAELLARFPDAKAEYFEDERPQHRVRITQPFYLGQHEVTVGQFRKFVAAKNYKTEPERDGQGGWGYNAQEKKFEGRKPQYNWKNTGFTQDDNHPVVNVTWNDATAFCQWLSDVEGKTYRLPTEAQWEYACRAGSRTLYQTGDDPEGLAALGNVSDGTAKAMFSSWTSIASRDGYVFTAPVGQYAPNAFGLYDMHGNVWEWCADWYDKAYYGDSPDTDPTGPSSGSARVIRGGGWTNRPHDCRSAYRDGDSPVYRDLNIGFRVVLLSAGSR